MEIQKKIEAVGEAPTVKAFAERQARVANDAGREEGGKRKPLAAIAEEQPVSQSFYR